jgi:hypothetical protein
MSNSPLVQQATTYLKSLSRRRQTGLVSADDVHSFLDRNNAFVGNSNVRLSFIRRVLRKPTFVDIMNVPSKRPVAKGRKITGWIAR